METGPNAFSESLAAGAQVATADDIATTRIACSFFAARALYAGPAYWFAMFAASAFGTNLGDFWVDRLFHDCLANFTSLVVICGFSIWKDRRFAARMEAAYWVATVDLRAAASNVDDHLRQDLALVYVAVTFVLGIAALLAARSARTERECQGRRAQGGRMVLDRDADREQVRPSGGDLTARTIDFYAAPGVFYGVLLLLIAARGSFAPTSIPINWWTVLAERCAGTAAGDTLASDRAFGLGRPVAMMCTGGLLVVALLVRARRAPARHASRDVSIAPAPCPRGQ